MRMIFVLALMAAFAMGDWQAFAATAKRPARKTPAVKRASGAKATARKSPTKTAASRASRGAGREGVSGRRRDRRELECRVGGGAEALPGGSEAGSYGEDQFA